MALNLRALIGATEHHCARRDGGRSRPVHVARALRSGSRTCAGEIDGGGNTDIRRILRQFEIAPEALERELGKALDGFKTGNQRTPALSAMLPKLFEAAWGWASIEVSG